MMDSLNNVSSILVEKIIPSPFNSRRTFDEDKIKELSLSIKEGGLINPITVRPVGDKYEIVCGERRLRACKVAGFTVIDARIRTLSDADVVVLQVTENLQREDLNPVEQAQSLKQLQDKFGYSSYKIAKKIGRAQTEIVNILGFLGLRKDFQQYLIDGVLKPAHIKPIHQLKSDKQLDVVKEKVEEDDFTVRSLWQLSHDLVDEQEKRLKVRCPYKSKRTLRKDYKPVEGFGFEVIVQRIRDRTNNKEINMLLDLLCKIHKTKH